MGVRGRVGACILAAGLYAQICFAQGNPLNTPIHQTASPENLTVSQAAAPGANQAPVEYAGEFFGVSVPLANYYFVRYAVAVFGNRLGPQPKTEQEIENVVWDQLLLSYEAFRRNIEVAVDEVDREIAKILEAEKVAFDWKKDKDSYAAWVKQKINEPAVAFENQIRHLLQIEKLRQKVSDEIKPVVSLAEAKQEFLNEYNTLSVELRQFDDKKTAQEFYKKAKADAKFWEQQKKINESEFKRPGFVSLEFLMDLWKFPKEGLYAMMKENAGQLHKPEPIYKGFGVFKILEKRVANEKEFAKVKDSYYNKITRRKQYEGMLKWFDEFKKQANIKVFPVIAASKNPAADGSAVGNGSAVGGGQATVTQDTSKGGV